MEKRPQTFPHVFSSVIPANIAPLNFKICEPGDEFFAKLYGNKGDTLCIKGQKNYIIIPQQRWKTLLKENTGEAIFCNVYTKSLGFWNQYVPLTDTIADEPIDPVLVYRRINICVQWMFMGIFQRSLSSFDEKPVFRSQDSPGSCMHCHTFKNNNPDRMALQIRDATFGTPMILTDTIHGKPSIAAVSTQRNGMFGKAGFTAWHPTQNLLAFSTNSFTMLYHSTAQEVRDVFDKSSDIAFYIPNKDSVYTIPELSDPSRIETMPEWSRDGSYLYFCSSPQVSRDSFANVTCDLLRIRYDMTTSRWGKIDTVLTHTQAGGSITQPRISPDNKHVMFTVSPYSDFPVHQQYCSVYIMDLASKAMHKVDNGGGTSDTWHSWSSNGKWIVFTSKRMNGRFSRPYLCFVDSLGIPHSPFVLPSKDPSYYESCIQAFTVPELVTGAITSKPIDFVQALHKPQNTTYNNTATNGNPYKAELE